MSTRSEAVFEKLGLFYLGSPVGSEEPLLYDSRDLLTHAICVGMTGSGKTGLGIGLIEEAAMDDVPAIVIDPKGDLSNLLLTFPKLDGASLEPWVDPEAARRKGQSVEEYAAAQADTWRDGLASWGQTADRIARLRAKVDMTVYTPGSTAGVPVSILDSFAAPPPEIRDDAEAFGDRVESTATSLLALLGVDGDPLQTPEHIFLSNVLATVWKRGEGLDLAGMIRAIQRPPMDTIGVMAVDDVFGPKDRMQLAMRVNSLVASPGFSAWLEGQPLDVGRFLWTPEGKPRISIFHVAHLNDSERMFFVSMLLQRVVGWTRQQPGSSSLRAMLYMDEIFGYVPPVAQPPSKKPIMTLLKQARAFGLGVVLATQNPADIDYKAISNAGTWFLGRLQTERDVARVMEGLEAASAQASGSFDRGAIERTLAGLKGRQFLLHNVHEDAPEVFQTRWVMSYLRGPLTRADIQRLMADKTPDAPTGRAAIPAEPAATKAAPQPAAGTGRPAPIDGVDEAYLSIGRPQPDGSHLLYRPMAYGHARVQFDDPRKGLSESRNVGLIASIDDSPTMVNWESAFRVDLAPDTFLVDPPDSGQHFATPGGLRKSGAFDDLKDRFEDHLYRNERLEMPNCPTLKLEATPGETIESFRARRDAELRRQRDDAVDAARSKWEQKLRSAEDRVFRAEQKVAKEEDDVARVKRDAMMDVGGALLSSFFGRRRSTVGRVTRGVTKNMKEQNDVERAQEQHAREQEKYEELAAQMQADLDQIAGDFNPLRHPIGSTFVTPDRNDVDVTYFVLAWVPYFQLPNGERVRAT